jgi:phenylacetate-CoA ligase
MATASSPARARPADAADLGRAIDMARQAPFYATPAWREAFALEAPTLARLPRVTKSQLREHSPEGFLPAGVDLKTLLASGDVEEESTSGTSGASVRVVFGRTWWAEQEGRALRQNPFIAEILDRAPDLRRAVLTTPGCSGVSCYNRWLSREQRTLGASLFVNQARIPFSLGEEKSAVMAAEVSAWAPGFLDVDPVHGAWFALHCERHGLRFPSLRFILTSYEFTSCRHRAIMERVFGVPVINLYGSSETGHLLVEAGDRMRPSPATALLEVADVDAAGVGELLVTTLTNPFLPLIRYEIGDYVEAMGDGYRVHGRKRDALRGSGGRVVTTHQVDRLMEAAAGVVHYQLRQAADGTARLCLLPEVPGDALTTIGRELAASVGALLGHPVTAETVGFITPEDSGKFRLTLRESA